MSDIIDQVLNETEVDLGAEKITIRQMFVRMMRKCWLDDGFSGKRPLGDSGWRDDVIKSLVDSGLIRGEIDCDGDLVSSDDGAGGELVLAALDRMAENEKDKDVEIGNGCLDDRRWFDGVSFDFAYSVPYEDSEVSHWMFGNISFPGGSPRGYFFPRMRMDADDVQASESGVVGMLSCWHEDVIETTSIGLVSVIYDLESDPHHPAVLRAKWVHHTEVMGWLVFEMLSPRTFVGVWGFNGNDEVKGRWIGSVSDMIIRAETPQNLENIIQADLKNQMPETGMGDGVQ